MNRGGKGRTYITILGVTPQGSPNVLPTADSWRKLWLTAGAEAETTGVAGGGRGIGTRGGGRRRGDGGRRPTTNGGHWRDGNRANTRAEGEFLTRRREILGVAATHGEE